MKEVSKVNDRIYIKCEVCGDKHPIEDYNMFLNPTTCLKCYLKDSEGKITNYIQYKDKKRKK